VSMLLMWLSKTAPDTANPSGSTTRVGKAAPAT
jgi:hypothetical protein